MNERETAETIEDRAIAWVAAIDRAGDDDALAAELAEWLAGDPRRQGAYFRAQSAWVMLDRASVLGAGAPAEPAEPPLSRRRLLWGAGTVAASLVASAVGVGHYVDRPVRIETALGEIRRIPLKDGSLATINTSTRLAVALKPEIRRVSLSQGEAWFQVAHDTTRPFIVEAGDVRVRAVGTAFSVRRGDTGADVQVTEGIVEVWSVGAEENKRRIGAGSHAFVSEAPAPIRIVAASAAIDRSLAWRAGQLVFDGDTLEEAAAEFNRYNRVQVSIADRVLAREKLVGRFRTNEPDAFAQAAALMLGARAQIGVDAIILSRN